MASSSGVNSSSKTQTVLAAAAGCAVGLGIGLTVNWMINNNKRKQVDEFKNLKDEVVKMRQELVQLRQQLVSSNGQVIAATREQDITKQLASRLQALPSNKFSVGSSLDEYFDADELTPYSPPARDIPCSSAKASDTATAEPSKSHFDEVDKLCMSHNLPDRQRAYDLLLNEYHKNDTNVAVVWRLARATYLLAQMFAKEDETKRRALIEEAYETAKVSEKLNADNADVQKWCAITVGAYCDFVGVKEKIQLGYTFKNYVDRALALRSDDPVVHHIRARWCYSVAALSFWERKIASTLFAEPPTATYEEALDGFLQAEKYKPNSWLDNMLWTAKTYIALNRNSEAEPYLRRCLELDALDPDDELAKDEARQLCDQLFN